MVNLRQRSNNINEAFATELYDLTESCKYLTESYKVNYYICGHHPRSVSELQIDQPS